MTVLQINLHSENLFPKDLCCSLAQVATNPSPDVQFSLYLQLYEFSGVKPVNFVQFTMDFLLKTS